MIFIDVEYWKEIPPTKITYKKAQSGEIIKFGVGGLQLISIKHRRYETLAWVWDFSLELKFFQRR